MNPSSSGDSPELSVAQVLRTFLPDFLQTHALPVHHLKVLRRLAQCRSGELGYTLWDCQDCTGSFSTPNGCGDRHCSGCQHRHAVQWLEKQRQALLPVRCFHWVFTLPALVRALAWQNPALLYGLLFDAAGATLLQFGLGRFGAELGLTAILHTWGQVLNFHPHLHCLVTGGGLTPQNTGAGPKQLRYLFPIRAVAVVFRAKFCDGLLQLHATGKLQFHGECQKLQDPVAFAAFLRQLRAQRWNVFAKGSVVGPDAVLDYLGRYTHRVALSNGRLRSLDPQNRTVSFTYKDYADGDKIKLLPLKADEFIRRLLRHVLPPSFTKIRHYGLLGNNRRKKQVALARAALESSPLRHQPKTTPAPSSLLPPPSSSPTCPFCEGSNLRCLGRLDRSGKFTAFPRFLFQISAAPADTS